MNYQQASSLAVRRLAAAALAMATSSALAQTSITTDTTISSSQTYSGEGLNVGSGTSPGPTLTINSGANLTVSNMFAVGTETGAYAAVVQNSGTVSVGAAGTTPGQLYLGVNRAEFGTRYSPGSASYTLNGGSITLGSAGSEQTSLLLLGRSAGNNTFTQNGGTVTVHRTVGTVPSTLLVGNNGQGQNTYTITSGTFEGIGVTSQGRGMSVGGNTGGDGTMTINGSSAVIAVQQSNAVFSTGGGSATINLNAGTLALNGNVTRGVPSGTIAPGAVAFTLGGGTLRPYDANLAVGVFSATNTLAFDITLAANTTSTITGVGWKTGTHTVLMDTPLIGSGNIEISGGTVVFNRSGNTYSGSTTVSGGTLSLDTNGAFSDSPLITIASGAALSLTGKTASGFTFGSGQTLAGSGSVLLPTSGSGVSLAGFLAPGGAAATGTLGFTGAGVFSIESAITSATGRLQFGLDSLAASDQVTVASGTLAIGSGLLNFDDFDFTALAGFGQGTYTLFSADSILGTLGSGTSGTINGLNSTLQQSGGDIQLVVVPEPAGLALAGLGIAAAAWAGRRRPARAKADRG